MENDSVKHRFGLFLSIIPIPIFLFLAIFFYLTGLENSIVFDPPALLPALNLFFLFLCPMVAGILAAKGYLENGSMRLLMLGSGLFSLAFGSLIAGFMLPAQGPNAVITVHNVSAFLSGIFHLVGTAMSIIGFSPQENTVKRKTVIAVVFSGIFVFLVMITFGVLKGVLPVFFLQGQGATLLRQFILGFAVLSFFISGLLLMMLYRDSRIRFLSMYAEALFLISIGLGFVFIQKFFGSPIGWLGRIAQYTGGIYLLIAVLSGAKEFNTKILLFDKLLEKFFHSRFEILLSERTKELTLANEQLQIEIHERKLMENKLQESEEKYRGIFAAESDAIFLIDMETGAILETNNAACDLYGYTQDELIRLKNMDVSAEPEKTMQATKELKKTIPLRYHKKKDGTIFPVDISANMFVLKGRDVILAAIRDITDRKMTEKLLQQNEERLRLSLSGADLGMWDWDIISGVVTFNERWASMLGYTLDEIQPNVSSWETLLHPDDMPNVMETLNAHIEGIIDNYKTEHRLRHKSGQWIYVLDCGRVIERDVQGKALRACGTHLDITERKKADEERERLISELKDALEKVKKLSGLLPICSFCKKIRDDRGYWNQIESYIHEHSEAEFSHGICQDCAQKHYPDLDIYDD